MDPFEVKNFQVLIWSKLSFENLSGEKILKITSRHMKKYSNNQGHDITVIVGCLVYPSE